MTGDEFQAQCATTRDPGLSRDSLILNAALGMSAEAAQRMLDAHDQLNDYGQDGSPEEMDDLFRAYNEAADGLRESLR